MSKKKVAVIGSGVSGLSSALQILQKYKEEVDLTIIAEDELEDTTSMVAAGLWRPNAVFGADEPLIDLMKRWYSDTRRHYEELIGNGQDSKCGVSSIFLVKLIDSSEPNQHDCFRDITPLMFHMTRLQLEQLYPHMEIDANFDYGILFQVFLCRPRLYLPWIREKIQELGGNFKIGTKIDSFESLVGTYDLVVNCTAMGAKVLAGDQNMIPIKGQVTLVEAPWITAGLSAYYDCYIFPGCDGTVTLGGSYETGRNDRELDEQLKQTYLEKCYQFYPSLRQAKVIKDMAGVRPYRIGGPRVELEQLNFGSHELPVIHNYGHGPEGWGLHWGTSSSVLELFSQWIN